MAAGIMANPKFNRNKSENYVCYCNKIPKEPIENAIRRGCDTLPRIFDATNAGVGACGGSCRPYILKMIETYWATGSFPEHPRTDGGPKTKKR